MISRRPRQNKIDAKNAEIAEADKEIKATESFIEAITATRVQENDDFKKAKEKDQQAIALLVQVRDVMSKFYKSETGGFGDIQGSIQGASLAQKKKQPEFAVSAFDAPEATFSKADKRENEAKGIVQILTMVIEDLNDEIANSMKIEESSQKTYEAQKFSAEMLIAKLKAKIVFLEGVIANTIEEKTEEEAALAKHDKLHVDESTYLNGILPDCQWVFKAFFERADARVAEMEGLTQAKEYLVGYNPDQESVGFIRDKPQGAAFAQVPRKFDDEVMSKLTFGLRR